MIDTIKREIDNMNRDVGFYQALTDEEDIRFQMNTERNIGLKEGIEKGIIQGHEQGIAEGLEQGIAKGLEQGIAEGLEQGIAKGLEQGIEQGIEQGKNSTLAALAIQMKTDGYSDEQIDALLNRIR